jgi:hypothetical protein
MREEGRKEKSSIPHSKYDDDDADALSVQKSAAQ